MSCRYFHVIARAIVRAWGAVRGWLVEQQRHANSYSSTRVDVHVSLLQKMLQVWACLKESLKLMNNSEALREHLRFRLGRYNLYEVTFIPRGVQLQRRLTTRECSSLPINVNFPGNMYPNANVYFPFQENFLLIAFDVIKLPCHTETVCNSVIPIYTQNYHCCACKLMWSLAAIPR